MTAIAPAEKSLYDLLKDAGCEMDSWQHNLHVLATAQARSIIRDYRDAGYAVAPRLFQSEVDGRKWIELPFHFTPFWSQHPDQDDGLPKP